MNDGHVVVALLDAELRGTPRPPPAIIINAILSESICHLAKRMVAGVANEDGSVAHDIKWGTTGWCRGHPLPRGWDIALALLHVVLSGASAVPFFGCRAGHQFDSELFIDYYEPKPAAYRIITI
jgi:hypothetical protein